MFSNNKSKIDDSIHCSLKLIVCRRYFTSMFLTSQKCFRSSLRRNVCIQGIMHLHFVFLCDVAEYLSCKSITPLKNRTHKTEVVRAINISVCALDRKRQRKFASSVVLAMMRNWADKSHQSIHDTASSSALAHASTSSILKEEKTHPFGYADMSSCLTIMW